MPEQERIYREQNGKPVGYCHPPVSHQFKPGHSGNPAGRPKGRRNKRTIRREIAAIFDFEHLIEDIDRGFDEALAGLTELGL